MREIGIRILEGNGNHIFIKAVALIAVVRSKEGFVLDITENGELTEEWWLALPQAIQKTIKDGLKGRVTNTQ